MSPMQLCRWMWLVWALIWVLWALRTKRTQIKLNRSDALAYMVPTAIGAYLCLAETRILRRLGLWRPDIPPLPWLLWLGAAVTLAGLLFAIWARAYLGKNWSGTVTIKHDHELVRSGPYRFVRHPIYSGILVALAGTTVSRRNLWGFLGLALIWLGLWLKSRMEERFMIQTFGAQYEDYRRTTGAILPRL